MSRVEIVGRDPETDSPVRVYCCDGVITSIEKTSVETDQYVSAGFVDLQVNGHSGFDLNAEQISGETVAGLVDAMLANGVTCFAPTLITASEESLCRALNVIARARAVDSTLAMCIPFVHVEGPHISAVDGYLGAHPAEFVRLPSIAEFKRWQQASDGLVGLVTLSPHFEGSAEYIRALTTRGVHVAIGHTHASPEQIKGAVDAGARLSTHLGNGIEELIPRHRNPIWPQLADDRLSATFIADGHHLPSDVLKVMLRAKGVGRSILVSDAVALAGKPAGDYSTAVGGKVELHADGKLTLFGSEYLAGSTASLPHCVSNVVKYAGVALKDALRMATANPGAFAGERGRLAVGARADLVRFEWTDKLIVQDVWLSGKRVCEGGERAVEMGSISR